MEIGLVIVDHVELLKSPERSPNRGDQVNAIYNELLKLSLQFNGGAGLPLMVLHQSNREGKKSMTKEGRYTTQALSQSHAAERNASVITAGILDEAGRANGWLKMQCLKNRENPFFEDFQLRVDWPSKRLACVTDEVLDEIHGMTIEEIDLSEI